MVVFYFLIFLNLKEDLITVNEHLMTLMRRVVFYFLLDGIEKIVNEHLITGDFMVGPIENGCFLFSFR
ncbi:hypothetical protein CICLE_v10013290mg [Citrus x clementina]|uniref:Uncharacterized protein n=1 Tax=Citrus clementina TaxID=85681 RepID=V4SPQ0_CITCL|nr:hypothetical protein CICLE_v10013290mg [Citrus x clementina]